MREIRQSGSEGGVALTRHPYPYAIWSTSPRMWIWRLVKTARAR